MVVSSTLMMSCLLMVIAFGFGALLGFNLINGGSKRRHPKLYEYRYKPVTLSLSEAEVRARIRELADEKEASSARALLKGRAAKPVQRVTATMAPTPIPAAPAADPFVPGVPSGVTVPEKTPEVKKQAPEKASPVPQAAQNLSPVPLAAEKSVEAPVIATSPASAVKPVPAVPAPAEASKVEASKSADIINLGQRRPGLVFYRVDNRPEARATSDTQTDRPPVSPLATLSPDALVILVGQVGTGHEPFRLETADGTADELSLISGVNETLGRALNRLGIYHFWQIAAWGAEHVAWVAARVPGGERIARENWIAQAARLMNMPRRVFNTDED
jgi:hypothetical protein